MTARVPNAELLELQGLFFLTLWRSGGLMLVGMAFYRLGWLTGGLSVRQYLRSGSIAFVLGTGLISYGVYRDFAEDWSMRYAFFIGSQFNYWGSLAVAWSWISLVLIACRNPRLLPLTRRFAMVGRMAFSNYILETILCTTIFYGHGFGMFARFDRVEGMLVVFAVWVFLFIFSQLWMRSFYSGPLEWLWRSLTYRKIQPLRRLSHSPL